MNTKNDTGEDLDEDLDGDTRLSAADLDANERRELDGLRVEVEELRAEFAELQEQRRKAGRLGTTTRTPSCWSKACFISLAHRT